MTRSWNRWVSFEPLLGWLDIPTHLRGRVDWAVIGAESGSNARACNRADIRWLVQRILADTVPVYVKQLSKADGGADMDWWPEDMRVRQVPGDFVKAVPAGGKL